MRAAVDGYVGGELTRLDNDGDILLISAEVRRVAVGGGGGGKYVER